MTPNVIKKHHHKQEKKQVLSAYRGQKSARITHFSRLSAMEQSVLDLTTPFYPTFDNFVGKNNDELVHWLKEKSAPCLYLWGTKGLGKSHLLQATFSYAIENHQTAQLFECRKMKQDDFFCGQQPFNNLVLIDDVDFCQNEQALFDAFNRWNDAGVRMIFSATVPPRLLPLRPDLQTRMGWCAAYQVFAPDDDEKITALKNIVRHRQLNLDEEILTHLIKYHHRDLSYLIDLIDKLENYAMMKMQRITYPLLNEFLRKYNDESRDF